MDQFIQGINSANPGAALAAFSPSAELIDDGKSFKGEAIRAFVEAGLIGHHAQIAIVGRETLSDGSAYVHVKLDGDFKEAYNIEEPFDLYLVATLDGGKIQHLNMGDVDPKQPTMRTVYAAVGSLDNPVSSIRVRARNTLPPQDGWVRVKMEAAGLNFHDIFTLRGIGVHPIRFPMILGNEGAGVLDDGTEVAIYPNLGDPDFKGDETIDPTRHVFGEKVQGTLAEYIWVPKRNAVPRPAGMDATTAGVMGIAWLTAYRMIFTQANLRAGQTVLVQGSSGGVATALIQLGSAAGFRVWTTGRSEAKRKLATSLGAERTFEPLATLPQQVDAVFDVSGASTIAHSIASVKPGGVVVSCGVHSDSSSMTVEINLAQLFVNQISLKGVFTGTREEFVNLLSFVSAKGIKPYIGKTLALENAAEGLGDIWEGRTQGKIVVTF